MTCFRVNAPKVVHDVIEGEAVLVNLDNGQYYSTDKVGADVWTCIEQGVPVSQIVAEVCGRYEGSREEIERGVGGLLTELQKEGLIVPEANAQPRAKNGSHSLLSQEAGERSAFEPPRLHKYSDMEDLLLLDPIHEVDATGWPNVPLDEK